MTQEKIFKKCGMCGLEWKKRDDFLNDCSLELIGYQTNFKELELGLLLFNHACGTTVAVQAGTFRDLYKGTVYDERKTGTEECPEHCLHEKDLEPCPAKCECAWVREVIQILQDVERSNRIKAQKKKSA